VRDNICCHSCLRNVMLWPNVFMFLHSRLRQVMLHTARTFVYSPRWRQQQPTSAATIHPQHLRRVTTDLRAFFCSTDASQQYGSSKKARKSREPVLRCGCSRKVGKTNNETAWRISLMVAEKRASRSRTEASTMNTAWSRSQAYFRRPRNHHPSAEGL
jgi:hypothetical protein